MFYMFSTFQSCCRGYTPARYRELCFLIIVYQVPGLAPPGVVIPQLASSSGSAAPGPPSVVIPRLATTGSFRLLISFFQLLKELILSVGHLWRMNVVTSIMVVDLWHG